jgi:hypothetical protein
VSGSSVFQTQRNTEETDRNDQQNSETTEKDSEHEHDDVVSDGENENDRENNTDNDTDEEETMESENEARGIKRGDEVLDDSFRKNFPPLKTRRPSQVVPRSIESRNSFAVQALDPEDPPLVIDESDVRHGDLSRTDDGHLLSGK